MEKQWVSHICDACNSTENIKRCEKCKVAYFCGVECQKKAWAKHKKECAPVRRVLYEIAAKWFETKKFDLSKVDSTEVAWLAQCGMIKLNDHGDLDWVHDSFGEYLASRYHIGRICNIVNNEEREAEIKKLKEKYPYSQSEPVFGTFFHEGMEDEIKKRFFISPKGE